MASRADCFRPIELVVTGSGLIRADSSKFLPRCIRQLFAHCAMSNERPTRNGGVGQFFAAARGSYSGSFSERLSEPKWSGAAWWTNSCVR
jgi:hypothetical protein